MKHNNRIRKYLKQDPFKVLDDNPSALLFTDSKKKTILHVNTAFKRMFDDAHPEEHARDFTEIVSSDYATDLVALPALSQHIEVNISGQKYNLILSGSSVGDHMILQVIQNITKVLSDVGLLREEVKQLKEQVAVLVGPSEIITICSICHKVKARDGSWVPPYDPEALKENASLSHGFCPACSKIHLKEMRKELEDFKREHGKK